MQEQPEIEFDEAGDKIIKVRELTAEEKLYMERAKQKHRQNLTKDQVVQGKVFKGSAFISKPAKITFKDFTVGKTHSLTIHLTNVSNAFNSFNVLPLNELIRNFFEVEYTPQGKISPGLSCPLTFKFTPISNEDIFDEFCILAETGKISYPVECTSKKTIVTCQNPIIDFKEVIYGERGNTQIVLKNAGTLPSDYQFRGQDGQPLSGKNAQISPEIAQLLSQLKLELNGHIDGNCEHRIPIQITPKDVGNFNLDLQLHFKNFKYSPPIVLKILCECIKVPIYIEEEFYNLQLCLPGHIYRRKLIFHNRSSNPMKVVMNQPSETKKFFEFNPVLGYIQNQSSFEVWVKIAIDDELPAYLSKYHTGDGQYVVQFKLTAAGQEMPVPFTIRFKTTLSKLVVKPTSLNFGEVDEGYSSKIIVAYENKSDLPQSLMFYPIPKGIFFQSDQQGFKILPKETLSKWIAFRTEKLVGTKIKNDEGTLVCKVITGSLETQQIRFPYSCTTRQADLQVRPSKIDLPALQEGQLFNFNVEIRNTSSNRALVFQIVTPYTEVSGFKLNPVVKTLNQGQVSQISIEYQAAFRKLKATTIKDIENSKKPKEQPKKELPPVEPPKKQGKGKEAKKQGKLSKQQQEQLEAEQKLLEQQQKERIQKQRLQRQALQKSFDINKALSELGGKVNDFEGSQVYEWQLPIHYRTAGSKGAYDTTFITITSTVTQKKLTTEKQFIDFGEVAVGTRQIKQIKIINTTAEAAELHKDQLPVASGFAVINSLRTIAPGKNFGVIVQFQPMEELVFQERLRLYTGKYSITLNLKGKGMRPQVKLEPESGFLNVGSVLLDQYSQKSFKIKNITNFQLKFKLNKKAEGSKNLSGVSAMTYIPTEGTIEPGKDIEIKVKFKPDRLGQRFYDLVHILVPEQKDEKRIYIWGNCYPRQAYYAPYRPEILFKPEDLPKKIEWIYDPVTFKDEEKIFSPANNKIIVQFTKIDPKQSNIPESCLKRKFVIGSCRLLDSKLEKPTNFQVIMPKDDKFTCDNPKGTAAPGTETTITFTYKPPEGDPLIAKMDILKGVGQWKDIKGQLKLSGGFVKAGTVDAASYELIFRAYVNQL